MCQNTVDSLYLDYRLSRISLYLELVSGPLNEIERENQEVFGANHQIRLNFLSLSRTSLPQTSPYLKQKISAPLQLFPSYLELFTYMFCNSCYLQN